jgi:aspartate-semialdehyde dehydrogenase
LRSHSESITVTFGNDVDVDVEKCRKVINDFENVKVMDNLEEGIYPMPILSTDTDITLVGRIRKDIYSSNMLHFFNVADQVRVGAATNSIRIALKWIDMENS